MSTDSHIERNATSGGSKLDTTQVSISGVLKERERIVLVDGASDSAIAATIRNYAAGKPILVELAASDGSRLAFLPLATKDASNRFGATGSAVAPNATADLVSFTATSGYRFWGFDVTGTGDAEVSVLYNGIEKYFDLIGIEHRVARLRLPLPDPVSGPVILRVKNLGLDAATYKGVLYGE